MQSQEGNHLSPAKNLCNCNHFSPNKVARQLKLANEMLDAWENLEVMEEDLSAGVDDQPRQQP